MSAFIVFWFLFSDREAKSHNLLFTERYSPDQSALVCTAILLLQVAFRTGHGSSWCRPSTRMVLVNDTNGAERSTRMVFASDTNGAERSARIVFANSIM